MPSDVLLNKYARLIAFRGANVQKGQLVSIRSSVENYDFCRKVVLACYDAGASRVIVNYFDNVNLKTDYLYCSKEELCDVKDFEIAESKYLVDSNYARISLSSHYPNGMQGVDSALISAINKSQSSKMGFLRNYSMNNLGQWNVSPVPNGKWAKQIYPDLSTEEAIEKLWNVIFEFALINQTSDPLVEWDNHLNTITSRINKLNSLNLKALHFKNSLGTDLRVCLAKNHQFAGGGDITVKDISFSPNIPTYEIFGMPSKLEVNGHVVSTKPLNYQDTLIKDFEFTFKDGKVVDYKARVGEEALKEIVEFDEGSSYLGEVALISNDSPISNMNTIFYYTLFDENASCHLALGRCYATNVVNGINMTQEELSSLGGNFSNIHVDFMFGSADMSVIGLDKNDKEITIFEKGNFII